MTHGLGSIGNCLGRRQRPRRARPAPRAAAIVALTLALGAPATPPARAADDPGWLPPVRDALLEGRFEDALQALRAAPESDPDVAYLRARALEALDRPEEALAAAPRRAPDRWPAEVREDLSSRRASWAVSDTSCDLAALPAEGQPTAQCALARGDGAAALRALGEARGTDADLLRALALEALGRAAEAAQVYRRLAAHDPAHEQAEEWLRKLPGPPRWTYEERMTRAQGWYDARQFKEAVAELEATRPRGDRRARARYWHLLGMAQYRTRHMYAQAVRSLRRAARLKGETEAADAFHAARARSRAGDNRRAISDYRRFVRRYPRSRRVPEARYLAAWLELREGRRSARRSLRVVAEDPRNGRFARRAQWDLGWRAFGARRYLAAARWFERYAEASESPLARARGHYWSARALAARGLEGRAGESFQAAMHAAPLGWYAQLAARRLGFPAAAFPTDQAPSLAAPAVQLSAAVVWFARRGLVADAARLVEAAGFRQGELATVRAYALAGHAERAHRAAAAFREALLAGPIGDGNRWLWHALYPRPYLSLVQREASGHGLPPLLLYAHMQVESHYQADAQSGADAQGLLQLLPATAARVADSQGVVIESRAHLLRPALNVRLAAAYLGGLLRRFGGQLPLAVAGYNAGGHRVRQWLRSGRSVELDGFVEDIPITQTRNYVRRVLTHLARYRYLTDGDPWALGRELPDRVRLPPPT